MIDLHCHILPELDDGSRSVQDSIAMARQAAEDGIGVVCATPHIRYDHDVHIPRIATLVTELQAYLDAIGVPVRLRPGGEVAQSAAEHLTDEELLSISLGGTGRWVLLEPAPGPLDSSFAAVAEHLRVRGLSTIVAHPERHATSDLRERLVELADSGCLIQWTADFVRQAKRGDLVLDYAQDGLVHLLASDAHSSLAGRPVKLSAAFERLRQVCPDQHVRWMAVTAPQSIIAGEPVSIPW